MDERCVQGLTKLGVQKTIRKTMRCLPRCSPTQRWISPRIVTLLFMSWWRHCRISTWRLSRRSHAIICRECKQNLLENKGAKVAVLETDGGIQYILNLVFRILSIFKITLWLILMWLVAGFNWFYVGAILEYVELL